MSNSLNQLLGNQPKTPLTYEERECQLQYQTHEVDLRISEMFSKIDEIESNSEEHRVSAEQRIKKVERNQKETSGKLTVLAVMSLSLGSLVLALKSKGII